MDARVRFPPASEGWVCDPRTVRDGLPLDDEARYRAMLARDARFDGWFFIAVKTTGIYCRPSCPTPVHPKRRNVTFLPTAAAAQRRGFRACKRCRPDATPGSPEWSLRADLAGRALRLIADGVVDREGVGGLAAHVAVSERHLNRVLVDEVGAGPISLARAQRAQAARVLIETTDIGFAEIAFAAGFSSVRQFNDTMREVFAATPTALRATAGSSRTPSPVASAGESAAPVSIRLAVRAPFDHSHLMGFLAARAVGGVEACDGRTYSRSVLLAHGPAVVDLTPADDHVKATFHLSDLRDLPAGVARTRRFLDLDADPVSIDSALRTDPAMRSVVERHPGRRAPGALDPHELAVRAVLGQQVSVSAARTTAERITIRFGRMLPTPVGVVDRLFPDAETLAEVDPETLGVPRSRGRAVVALAAALAGGVVVLDAGADRAGTVEALTSLPGIGPWTASYIAMRALSDPDVLLSTDLAARAGAARLGLPDSTAALNEHARRWAPWRSYATHHLWTASRGASRSETT